MMFEKAIRKGRGSGLAKLLSLANDRGIAGLRTALSLKFVNPWLSRIARNLARDGKPISFADPGSDCLTQRAPRSCERIIMIPDHVTITHRAILFGCRS